MHGSRYIIEQYFQLRLPEILLPVVLENNDYYRKGNKKNKIVSEYPLLKDFHHSSPSEIK